MFIVIYSYFDKCVWCKRTEKKEDMWRTSLGHRACKKDCYSKYELELRQL